MTKTYRYTYKDINGKQTVLTKTITDRMEPRPHLKKTAAACYFTEMLKQQFGEYHAITVRNIQEV